MQKVSMCIPLVGLLLISCGNNNSEKSQEQAGKIPVISIVEEDIRLDKIYVSDIQAIQNVEIRSRIPGFLERIHIDEGQLVKKGQLLFTLNDDEYRAEVAKAQASLNSTIAEAKTAELEVERVELLVSKKIISNTELEVAKSKLRAMRSKISEAEATLTHARTRLAYTRIVSPYDGVIDRIPLKPGSLLDEGTLITSVSDISSVFAYFNISESEYLDYLRTKTTKAKEADNNIKLILADGKEYMYTGKIETVVSEFQDNTGSIAFRARFPNPHHLLKHGATGKVKLSTEIEDALMLPQKAVFEIQDKNYVYVLDGANKVHMKSFIPKTRLEEFYVVDAGLKPGEKIVYEGIQNISNGMVVTPQLIKLDSITRKGIL